MRMCSKPPLSNSQPSLHLIPQPKHPRSISLAPWCPPMTPSPWMSRRLCSLSSSRSILEKMNEYEMIPTCLLTSPSAPTLRDDIRHQGKSSLAISLQDNSKSSKVRLAFMRMGTSRPLLHHPTPSLKTTLTVSPVRIMLPLPTISRHLSP
jgi:hypothetical protein